VRSSDKTGEVLIGLLERRLDALVHRAGFARTVDHARQIVSHGHITVDGAKVDIASYRVAPGQVISVRESSRTKTLFQIVAGGAYAPASTPRYLSVSLTDLRATLIEQPVRREVPIVRDEQLVVEFYSR
jgi:small subunit ribosomal protein S4